MPEQLPSFVWVSFVPLALVCATSFLKVSVVLSLLRNALGTPDVPGPGVVYGLALAVTVVVMTPVATQVWERAQEQDVKDAQDLRNRPEALLEITQPWRAFLEAHAHPDVRERVGATLPHPPPDAPQIVLTVFMVSELKEAFSVGVLLFIPFLMVDLLVAYLLVSLGLTAINPQQLALPLKLLLFVSADGWTLVTTQLVEGYT